MDAYHRSAGIDSPSRESLIQHLHATIRPPPESSDNFEHQQVQSRIERVAPIPKKNA
jgi:hypothetical protein